MMSNSKNAFLKNMIGFSMVTWISFALGFLSSPIATRLFEPAELGKVNMFFSYTALMGSVCYLGLDQVFVRFFREPPAGRSKTTLFSFCLGIAVLASLLLTAGLCFFWQRLSIGVGGKPSVGIFVCLCLVWCQQEFEIVIFCAFTAVFKHSAHCGIAVNIGVFAFNFVILSTLERKIFVCLHQLSIHFTNACTFSAVNNISFRCSCVTFFNKYIFYCILYLLNCRSLACIQFFCSFTGTKCYLHCFIIIMPANRLSCFKNSICYFLSIKWYQSSISFSNFSNHSFNGSTKFFS